MRFELTAIENYGIAIILPQELLAQVGMSVGDQVDVRLVDQTIVLQPLKEAERTKRIEEITERLLIQRKSVYEALAEGVR
jgi:antitoxin component of MazEF toxin-antitoxin module